MTEFFFSAKKFEHRRPEVAAAHPGDGLDRAPAHHPHQAIQRVSAFGHANKVRVSSTCLQCLFFVPNLTLIIVRPYTQGHQGSVLQTTIPRINTTGHGKWPWTLRDTMPKVIGRVYAQVNETSWKNSRMTLCTSFQCFSG